MTRALVLVAVGLLTLGAFASQARPAQGEYVSAGEVASVDATTLTVRETRAPEAASPDASLSGAVRRFVVDGGTHMASGQKSIELADIRVGDDVTVRFVLVNGENLAKRIEVQSKETELGWRR
jgi:hypothetical protein